MKNGVQKTSKLEIIKFSKERQQLLRKKSLIALSEQLIYWSTSDPDPTYMKVLLHTFGFERQSAWYVPFIAYGISAAAGKELVSDKDLMKYLIRPALYRHRDFIFPGLFRKSDPKALYRNLITIMTTGTMRYTTRKLADSTYVNKHARSFFNTLADADKVWDGLGKLVNIGLSDTNASSNQVGNALEEWGPHAVVGSATVGVAGSYYAKKILDVALEPTLKLVDTVTTSLKSQVARVKKYFEEPPPAKNVPKVAKPRRPRATAEPPAVIVDIKQRPGVGKTHYGPLYGSAKRVRISGKEFLFSDGTVPSGYVEYIHKLSGSTRKTFTLKEVYYGHVPVEGLGKPVKDVISISVYYWGGLENSSNPEESKGRPLLLKVTYDKRTKWYENLGTSPTNPNTIWANFFANLTVPQLKEELDEANRKLNGAESLYKFSRPLVYDEPESPITSDEEEAEEPSNSSKDEEATSEQLSAQGGQSSGETDGLTDQQDAQVVTTEETEKTLPESGPDVGEEGSGQEPQAQQQSTPSSSDSSSGGDTAKTVGIVAGATAASGVGAYFAYWGASALIVSL